MSCILQQMNRDVGLYLLTYFLRKKTVRDQSDVFHLELVQSSAMFLAGILVSPSFHMQFVVLFPHVSKLCLSKYHKHYFEAWSRNNTKNSRLW